MYLLGYDIGSSSVKASLVNAESGKCVSSAFFPKTEAEIIAVKPRKLVGKLETGHTSGIGRIRSKRRRHQGDRYLLSDAWLGMCR